jgi:mycothiol synthase
MEDAPGVLEVVTALEIELDGEAMVDLGDILGDWSGETFDLSRQTMAVFEGDEPIADAEVRGRRAEVVVHPAHHGRGLGEALLAWSEEAARRLGVARLYQLTSDRDVAAADLLMRHGYEACGTSWSLKIDLADAPVQPSLPPGYVFADFQLGRDDRALFDVVETAFREIANREDRLFDEWAPHNVGRDDFDPGLVSLLMKVGDVVGAAIGFHLGDEGWVTQLAVDRDHRRRGLGRALLEESFRRFRDRGIAVAGLDTNSDTGALGLYHSAGMHIVLSYTRRERSL